MFLDFVLSDCDYLSIYNAFDNNKQPITMNYQKSSSSWKIKIAPKAISGNLFNIVDVATAVNFCDL